MLALTGSIHKEFDVTFVRARRGVQTQERINGRRAILANGSRPAKPGDWCRVKIVGENDRKTTYFVSVMHILQEGDGKSSTLQKMLSSIHNAPFHSDVEMEVIRVMRNTFGLNRVELLEFLLDILQAHALKPYPRKPLRYRDLSIVIGKLIEEVAADNAAARAVYYLRAACYCSVDNIGTLSSELERFQEKALKLI